MLAHTYIRTSSYISLATSIYRGVKRTELRTYAQAHVHLYIAAYGEEVSYFTVTAAREWAGTPKNLLKLHPL